MQTWTMSAQGSQQDSVTEHSRSQRAGGGQNSIRWFSKLLRQNNNKHHLVEPVFGYGDPAQRSLGGNIKGNTALMGSMVL